jgi:hypothetical protein
MQRFAMFSRAICIGLLFSLNMSGLVFAEQKPRVTLPTAREIQNAFRAPLDKSRIQILIRLTRAGAEADTPEIAAAVVEGLQSRLDKNTITDTELNYISWLGTCQQEAATKGLHSCLSRDDLRVVIAASWSLTNNMRSTPWELTRSLTERDAYSRIYALRRTVTAAAEQNASKEAVDFLIKTVSDSPGQLKFEAVRSLSAMTGEAFGGHSNKWSAWWAKARETFEPVPVARRTKVPLQATIAWDEPLPRFYDLPVYAQKVLFIIDRSSSMQIVQQGEARIDRARREMEKAVVSLPEETEFGIIAFNSGATPFSSKLVLADDVEKSSAVTFAQSLVALGRTNCYGALALALEADPNLEAIYFLSDGEPTTGAIVDPQLIVQAITAQNQLHRTSIYTLGIDARGAHEIFLQQLAAHNFGEYVSIR